MLCDKKHSHVQWRDFKMNVLVCDDDQQIVDSIIEELKKKSEETLVLCFNRLVIFNFLCQVYHSPI